MNEISAFFLLLKCNIKNMKKYKFDNFIGILGILSLILSSFFSLSFLLDNINTINGWNKYELYFLLGFSTLCISFQQIFFSSLWSLPYAIINGDLILILIRPMNKLIQYLMSQIDKNGITSFFVGISIMIASSKMLKIQYSLYEIIMLIFFSILASIISASIMLISMSLSFWLINSKQIAVFVSSLRDYAKYPLSIFPKVIQLFFLTIIPIGFSSFIPVKIFLYEPSNIKGAIILLGFTIVFSCIAYLIWCIGLNRYKKYFL